MEKLSSKFPSVKFIYSYADEDTGSNCGKGVIKNGVSEMNVPESGSIEAYELSFKLHPEEKDNYVLVDGKYEFTED